MLLGEGAHEVVDGHVKRVRIATRSELQGVIGNGHGGVGWDDVKMVRLDDHAIRDFLHTHGGFLGEELGEHAVMLGIEMLNENESHACVGGKIAYEFGERFDATGRRADSGD